MSARLVTLRDGSTRLSVTGGWLVPLRRVRELRGIAWQATVGDPQGSQHDPAVWESAEQSLLEQMAGIRKHALEWAERDAKEYAARPLTNTKALSHLPPGQYAATDALQRLRAAEWDVGQALGELVGVAPEYIAAWKTIQMLVDVYVAGEDLRFGTARRKADGSPRLRRPLGAACRKAGVRVRTVLSQIRRARRRSSSTKALATTASDQLER